MQEMSLSLSDRLRGAAATRGDEVLAQIPGVLRRVRLAFLVLAISVPLFLAGCLTILALYLLG